MSRSLHPLEATRRIRADYTRYLRTIYFFRDDDLRKQFQQALERPEFLVKDPILEAVPPFKSGRSIRNMIANGILHPDFAQLCSTSLPLDRPLYLHQDRAIAKVVSQGRNIVVASGTGSGKTETFLIPIFDHLLRQRESGLLAQPGVRALLLYPMNALANDQLKRLRSLLAGFPDVTFGRYTGETPQDQVHAEARFREQFPYQDLLPNEMISRESMWLAPPHILLTNYAMLEYLLLRPKDSPFFDGPTGQFWRFIALDEAHVYDGASGIEIAMLLRRLKDRVLRSEPGRLRCIATSATLGRGPQDFEQVAVFARDLFDETFESVAQDPDRQDVVEAEREATAALVEPWGEGSSSLYAALVAAIEAGVSLGELARVAADHGVTIAASAFQEASGHGQPDQAINRFLFALLRGDRNLHTLRNELGEPHTLADVADALTTSQLAIDDVVNLVNLAVRARPAPESLPLLPARYHVFSRALEGAFVCLQHDHPVHARAGQPRFFLTRHEHCPHCGSWVFELATCPRCGTAYIVGRDARERGEDGCNKVILRHPKLAMADDQAGPVHWVLTAAALAPDEDEAVVAGETLDQLQSGELQPEPVCLRCGAIQESQNTDGHCDCDGGAPFVLLHRVAGKATSDRFQFQDALRHCVGCGSRSRAGIVFRFLTGQDAPASVLATSLYQMLPADRDDRIAALPGQGRKLLVFSDSRQDAAYFAPYLERTYRQILRRRLILKSLLADAEGRAGRLRMQDLVSRLVREAEDAILFSEDMSFDKRNSLVSLWLAQEFVALDYRIGLEGLGLLHFRLVPPRNWRPPEALLQPPWRLNVEEVYELLLVLLNSLRLQGAVTYPPNVDPRHSAFEPRNRALYLSDIASAREGVLGWLPRRGSNRRADYLERLLIQLRGIPAGEAKSLAERTLAGLWRYFTDPSSLWRSHLAPEQRPRVGPVYRLDHRYWEWVPVEEAKQPVHRCSRCFNVSYINLGGVCPTYGCDGILERADTDAEAWASNHYRHLYLTLSPIMINAQEHTAQWTADEAGRVQDSFIDGRVNVLSSSTTFELGVDVGELQAVLMRNVPPTSANYVQRAGRAGRRIDTAALVLTFAQRRSHDLTHFNQPLRLVAGKILPPVLAIANEKIVRRHIHSVCLAASLRWAKDVHGREFANAGAFFDTQEKEPSGMALLREYLDQRPAEVRNALERIVPTSLQASFGIPKWDWLALLIAESAESEQGILDRAATEVTGDLEIYAKLEKEAAGEGNYRLAQHFQGVARTVRRRELLGFLGARNVLPAYGFPTDVVELRTAHVPEVPEARRIELQRDLRIAISEYAPGCEVVAAKRIWSGGGLYLPPEREWQTINYAVCSRCGRFHRSLDKLGDTCQVTGCGGSLYGYPRRYGSYVIPEFGFMAARTVRETTDRRPHRIYSSRVYFSEYTPSPEEEVALLEPVPELSNSVIQVTGRYSRFGKLAVVNNGVSNAGFRVCMWCGWAEQAPEMPTGRRPRHPPPHLNLRTGKSCAGYFNTFHLGHEFITDVLEVRFEGYLAQTRPSDLWLSTLYALLEGASAALGIPRDDLDGVLYPYQDGMAPALVFFDNVPGGAGHMRRLADALPAVVRAAWQRLDKCECGKETSCYECLRNFYNQYCHDQLRRGVAADFLANIVDQLPHAG